MKVLRLASTGFALIMCERIMVFRWIDRHIDAYERYLAFILPRHLLYFEMEVVK